MFTEVLGITLEENLPPTNDDTGESGSSSEKIADITKLNDANYEEREDTGLEKSSEQNEEETSKLGSCKKAI